VLAGKLGSGPAQPTRAFCSGWNCAFDDPEPQAAARTANALGLPLEILEAADGVPLARPGSAWVEPEPPGDLFSAQFAASLTRMAETARVNLDGQGGDEIFAGEPLLTEAGRAPLSRLAADALRAWSAVRRPPLGLRARLFPAPPAARLPDYLDRDWQRGLSLPERLRDLARATAPPGRRPTARARLLRRIWGPYLEGFDAGFTGVAIQTRWPFLDERVVGFALSLPPLPWCVDKHLLRLTLRGVLPSAVTSRPKTSLAGDPLGRFLSDRPDWLASAARDVGLGGRVQGDDWQSAPRAPGDAWQHARPVALAQWLRRSTLRLKPFSPRAIGALKSGEPQLAQACP